MALLFLDLERFKVINDGIGHAAGDELLVAVAQRLTPYVTGRGSLARFGGDEFVAVLEGFAHPQRGRAGRREALVRVASTVQHQGLRLVVGGTIGVAIASQISAHRKICCEPPTSRSTGPRPPAEASPRSSTRASIARDWNGWSKRRTCDGRWSGASSTSPINRSSTSRREASWRLRRCSVGIIPSEDCSIRPEFIPLADETGLIVPLGRWVIEEACRQVSHWQDVYPAARSLQVSVNLSARQFRQDDLENDIAEALGKTGLAPESLALELKRAMRWPTRQTSRRRSTS